MSATTAQSALEAKNKGNELFKKGQLAESVQFYKQAEELDVENPIYPSNLSAALYEMADYFACTAAISRASSLVERSELPNTSLTVKLSNRLAKALCHGVQNGAIPTSEIDALAPIIDTLASAHKENDENRQAWDAWHSIQAHLGSHAEWAHEARLRLSRMSIYKGTPLVLTLDPTLTYFVFGNDAIMSLVDDLGPEDAAPIKLNSLSTDTLKDLSFLIGGVGDARHVFGTLIGLSKAWNGLIPLKRKAFKTHLTLLDIHSATLARNLIICMLVEGLLENKFGNATRLEYQSTLVFVYVGWIIPTYCETILMNTIENLLERLGRSPPDLPTWIFLNPGTVQPIIEALTYWLTEKSKVTAGVIDNLKYMTPVDRLRAVSRSGGMDLAGLPNNPLVDECRKIVNMLDNMSDSDLLGMGEAWNLPGANVADIRKLVKEHKESLIEKLMASRYDQGHKWGTENESSWYSAVQAFMPPSEFWSKHPGFENFRTHTEFNDDELVLKKIAKSVKKTWKPNITIIDVAQDGYTRMEFDVFSLPHAICEFNARFGLAPQNATVLRDSPVFAHVSAFFDGVVDAVRSLKSHVRLEFLCGEINQELAKINLQVAERSPDFPKKYTRIWLSNIPDYTNGTLNTITYVLPALKDTPEACVSSNCMWNSPVWRSDDEFCYNYTLLLPKDLFRYLGVRTLRGEAVMTLLTLGTSPLPRPLATLASRDELRAWLTRLLLSTLWPEKAVPRPKLVRLPNSLVAFVSLLMELQRIGYPGHWLAEFLQAVLSNTLAADHVVYTDSIPRPVSELSKRVPMHRVRLDPWQADLESILALTGPALPFALQTPAGLATTADEIGIYKAQVVERMLFKAGTFHAGDPSISLLFYKSTKDLYPQSLDVFILQIPFVIDGSNRPAPGVFHILTSQESVNFLDKSEIRWRMSKVKMQRMKHEGWSMVAWRTDLCMTAIEPCPASKWRELE